MKVVLVQEGLRNTRAIKSALRAQFGDNEVVVERDSLQQAIERLEAGEPADLIVCDYPGTSLVMLKALLMVRPQTTCICLLDLSMAEWDELFALDRDGILELVDCLADPERQLSELLERLKREGFFRPTSTPDSEYVRIKTAGLTLVHPLFADIYLRLAPNRYCKRFRAEDGFEASDLELHLRRKGIGAFYLRKVDAGRLLEAQARQVSAALNTPSITSEEAREAAEGALEVVHDLVGRLGFTPEIQLLAKKTAELTLKSLGANPKLSQILTRLKLREGRYVASHSLMLAEVACAIAARAGLGTSQNLIKLTLASFLHDLSVPDDLLAKVRSLDELTPEQTARFDPHAVRAYRFHPIKAAEYASCFDEIPSDVDVILVQHHEQCDGTGFPRGLFHHQLNSLSCVFILAHELLDYFLSTVPSNDRGQWIPGFLDETRPKYAGDSGLFQRIWASLAGEEPLAAD